MRLLVLAFYVSVSACDLGGIIVVESKDAGPDVLEPVPPLDAAACSCNGGFGVCFSVADCPPSNACCSFACEPAGEIGKQCVGKPLK